MTGCRVELMYASCTCHVAMLQVARCLLIEPNPESALNEEAGKMLLEDYNSYSERARLMTSIHAKAKKGLQSASDCDTTGREGERTSPKRRISKTEKDISDKKSVEKKRSLKRL